MSFKTPFVMLSVVAVTTIGFLASSVFLTGCGTQAEYQPPAIILPAHIKSISVRPFVNETPQPGIETKLLLAVTDEFIRDGRIRYVDKESEADGVVVGTLKQYRETELSHDVNLVSLENQIWIVMNLKFLDRSNNQYLWEEPLLEQKLRYFVETTQGVQNADGQFVGGKTEEEAREELWERFAQDIVRRTIEGFGTVTSSSPRAVPKDSLPDNPPPTYPSTAPF